MEDKITLGKFIQSKRKELGLSQKDLAKELYVTESAVSKWERGVSYPDITMISGLCRVLGISEHELCTASEDNQQREAEFMVRSYKSFVRGYTIITGIGYLAAIIPSFIYNMAHGGIGWFMVLITSLMLTFSFINVPVLVKKNRSLWTLGSATVSLFLLYAAGCIYSNGDWFAMAVLGTLLGEAIVFLPFVLRSEQLEKYVRNSKGLVCMAADSVLTFACVIYGTLKYGDVADLCDGMVAAVACVALVWAVFLIIRYLKVNGFFKGALCFAASAVWVAAMTFVTNLWNGMKLGDILAFKTSTGDNYDLIVCLGLLGVAAVLGVVGAAVKAARKRLQER
ncbi:helix-turn-helix transcriptional regulator [Ruminococcus sp.]|uniref:helix-turn-helix domain-containing protein n=1 Tax=Ruminococcus sp. TaxID=41978 RepID=UPI0025D0BC9D|nr:helix-turn-helix transcriptional regulator [Ruminococcus sp.]